MTRFLPSWDSTTSKDSDLDPVSMLACIAPRRMIGRRHREKALASLIQLGTPGLHPNDNCLRLSLLIYNILGLFGLRLLVSRHKTHLSAPKQMGFILRPSIVREFKPRKWSSSHTWWKLGLDNFLWVSLRLLHSLLFSDLSSTYLPNRPPLPWQNL